MASRLRTPEEHRRAVEATRANWPEVDEHYWHPPTDRPAPKPRSSKTPRHRAIGHDLAGLRVWFDLQSELPDGTWLAADNDNYPDADAAPAWSRRQTETDYDFIPSPEQMMVAHGAPSMSMKVGAMRSRQGDLHDVVDYGNLRFAGGRLLAWRETDLAQWRRPSEKYHPREASSAGATGGNRLVEIVMAMHGEWPVERHERDVQPRRGLRDWLVVTSWRCAGYDDEGQYPRTRTEDRALLRLHGVDGRVPFTRAAVRSLAAAKATQPALPRTGRLSDAFLGFRVRPSGTASETPAQSAANIEDNMIRAAEVAAATSLAARDQHVLAAAGSARTMSDVGKVIGFGGKQAEREGKVALIQAAKNLLDIVLAA